MPMFKITKIYPNAYRLTDPLGVYAFLLVGRDRSLLIDTGYGAFDLRKALRSLNTDSMLVCNTHAHMDHIGQDGDFPVCYLDPDDRDLYRVNSDPFERRESIKEYFGRSSAVVTNLPFLDSVINRMCYIPEAVIKKMPPQFDLGDRIIRVIKTPGHTPGSVCFLDEKYRAVFTGDTLCSGGIELSDDPGCSVSAYRESIGTLIRIHDEGGFNLIFPSHDNPVLDKIVLDTCYEACGRIISGDLTGQEVETMYGEALEAKFKNISITYSSIS